MRLKCLLLKSLQRVMAKQDSHRSERNTRGQAIFELDNKEINRKTPGRFLAKTRGDFNGDKIISRDPHVSPSDFLMMTILLIGRSLDDC